jgi:tRNA threonylcarbamoyladenosine biosynthesis protein TsaB
VRVLALETATPLAGCAIVDGSGVAGEATLRAPMRHLEWLLPAVDEMLRALGLDPDAIEAVAVSQGPGGFTGLRVGIATASAWARARGVPLLGVGTLEALAAAAGGDGLVLPVLDAHREEVAGALYRSAAGVLDCLVPPIVAPPALVGDTVAAVLGREASAGSRLLVIGDAVPRYGPALLDALGDNACLGGSLLHPRAAAVGLLARPRLLRGERDDPGTLLPIYGRRPSVRPWQETRRSPGTPG